MGELSRRRWSPAVLFTAALILAGCEASTTPSAEEASPTPTSIPTLTVSAVPEPPPTGRLIADMRQSSSDAAAGRMQVWIDNDTLDDVTPTRITYLDDRFRTPLPATRLREIPARSTRGFQIALPPRPACATSNDVVPELERPLGTVKVEYADRTEVLAVADETDVAGRYTRARCLEIAIARVVTLNWADEVTAGPAEDTRPGETANLRLVLTPTGRPGPDLTIETVSGTPILSPVGSDVWRPEVNVTGTDSPSEVALPLKPTRCDAHAFQESGGATAFKIGLRFDGEPGQITLRMTTQGAANAITFARASCGILTVTSD